MKYNAAHNVCASGYTCVCHHTTVVESLFQKRLVPGIVKDWHLK